MHSEGILAGELKHGPLALVDVNMPIIMIIAKDQVYAKLQNALQQVVARHVSLTSSFSWWLIWDVIQGRPIVICEEGDPDCKKFASHLLEVPHTVDCLQGILNIIPLQLLSFHMAQLKGLDVNQ